MRLRLSYIIVLFQLVFFPCWSQNIDNDIAEKKGQLKQKDGEVTLTVDTDIRQGEMEKARQDSIKQVNDKWKAFFTVKNNAITDILDTIQKIDSSIVKKENIDEYELQINDLKDAVDFKMSNNALWKDNDDLDRMHSMFFSSFKRASSKLDYWKDKLKPEEKEKKNWLLISGICFAALMISFPVINQLKAKRTIKRINLQQIKQANEQKEKDEIDKLLKKDDDIITLKG